MERTRHIGLLVENIDEEYPHALVQGAIRYGRTTGRWRIAAKHCRPILLWEDLRKWKGDGIIASVHCAKDVKRLGRLQRA